MKYSRMAVAALLLLLTGCGQTTNTTTTVTTTDSMVIVPVPPAEHTYEKDTDEPAVAGAWVNPLINKYIGVAANELIKAQPKDSLSWMYDRLERSDTAVYFVYQIRGFSSVYGWVYIDTLKRTLYEFDIANEVLVKQDI